MILIEFLEDAPELDEVATKAQAQTYRLMRQELRRQRPAKVADLLTALNIPYRCLISRLDHLQEKGLLRWGKSPIQTV